ncbi:MAG: NnrS family protein [Burkholderiales bacterium]|nr:NnrS family protein [Burkholderiales bacterium]
MTSRWQARHLLDAPHRLSFFLALCVLVFASAWWALVQLDRLGVGWGLRYVVSPTLMHSALMTFGFMPLLFSGFLFTAGPKWLGMRPVPVSRLVVPLGLQAAGWMLWVAGGHLGLGLAVVGVVLAWVGLAWIQWLFWRLLMASVVPDRLHATVIAVAGLVGVVALGAVIVSLLRDGGEMARLWVLTGLWGFIVATYVAVAHRMIPFFTASAVPMLRAWRPNWILGVLLAATVLEVLLAWAEWSGISTGPASRVWMLLRGLLELAIGSVIVWLAFVWGMVQSLKIRLLAMLHVGFVWLGIAFVLAGLSQLLGFHAGTPFLGLGTLHALTMGFLGSIMMAMVTRVSSGHSGRPLVADNLVWRAFWVLQLAVVLRIVGAVPGTPVWLMAGVALLWLGVVLAWGGRMLGWYGHLRADGQPG